MQMALDEALLRAVSKPTLRIYRWNSPWVSFGYFQEIGRVYESFPGFPVVRRWTGGGMVSHGEDLTFSLAIPTGEKVSKESPTTLYKKIHGALALLIRSRLPLPVQLAGSQDLRPGLLCFQAPVNDDLLILGKKVLGGAIRRSGGGVLYQGSLRIRDIPGWDAAMLSPNALARAFGESMKIVEISPYLLDEAQELAATRYSSKAWSQRK